MTIGLGFVGAVMAAVVADSTKNRQVGKFVIGMQRPSPQRFWKIPLLNSGVSPVKAEDPEVDILIKRCVLECKNLVVTYTYEALTLADVVIGDVLCDFLKQERATAPPAGPRSPPLRNPCRSSRQDSAGAPCPH